MSFFGGVIIGSFAAMVFGVILTGLYKLFGKSGLIIGSIFAGLIILVFGAAATVFSGISGAGGYWIAVLVWLVVDGWLIKKDMNGELKKR